MIREIDDVLLRNQGSLVADKNGDNFARRGVIMTYNNILPTLEMVSNYLPK